MKSFKIYKYTGRTETIEADSYKIEQGFVTFYKNPKKAIKTINSQEIKTITPSDKS